jgi:hypothetical protein
MHTHRTIDDVAFHENVDNLSPAFRAECHALAFCIMDSIPEDPTDLVPAVRSLVPDLDEDALLEAIHVGVARARQTIKSI